MDVLPICSLLHWIKTIRTENKTTEHTALQYSLFGCWVFSSVVHTDVLLLVEVLCVNVQTHASHRRSSVFAAGHKCWTISWTGGAMFKGKKKMIQLMLGYFAHPNKTWPRLNTPENIFPQSASALGSYMNIYSSRLQLLSQFVFLADLKQT